MTVTSFGLPMTAFVDGIVAAGPRVSVAVVLLVLGYVVSRLVRWGLRVLMRRRRTISFATVMSKLAGWFVLFGFVMAATAVAFPSVQPVDILAGLGFFSVAIGFAFQDILENLLSGVLLLLRQPFQAGDQITVAEVSGTVERITIRETRLKTFDGQLVLIPNRDVYKSVITVRTHYPSRRLAFVVGIAYENDAVEACRVIERRLVGLERVEDTPGPEALVSVPGVSTVDIEVRFWCGPDQHVALVALDKAITETKLALEEAGIEMPADIIALQATPSLRAALQGDGDVTPGGALRVVATEPRPG